MIRCYCKLLYQKKKATENQLTVLFKILLTVVFVAGHELQLGLGGLLGGLGSCPQKQNQEKQELLHFFKKEKIEKLFRKMTGSENLVQPVLLSHLLLYPLPCNTRAEFGGNQRKITP